MSTYSIAEGNMGSNACVDTHTLLISNDCSLTYEYISQRNIDRGGPKMAEE